MIRMKTSDDGLHVTGFKNWYSGEVGTTDFTEFTPGSANDLDTTGGFLGICDGFWLDSDGHNDCSRVVVKYAILQVNTWCE